MCSSYWLYKAGTVMDKMVPVIKTKWQTCKYLGPPFTNLKLSRDIVKQSKGDLQVTYITKIYNRANKVQDVS